MSDRVFPSSKPAVNGGTAHNAATTTPTPATTTPVPNPPPASTKSHLYNPTSRPPYRPQPRRRRTRSGRKLCCCCCFWSLLILLFLILMAAIAGAALYILYRPHRPDFSIPSFRLHRLNLTTSADSSSSHVASLFNFTVISKNPNSHLNLFYDPFTISSFSSDGDVFLGNGTLPAHNLSKKNQTSFRNVIVSGSNDLDADSVNALRSDLKKKNGAVTLKIQLDTKVKVKMGGLKTKKVGIRVTCDGIKGTLPKGKSPTVAVTSGSKCKVDLRIKIWKWTF
ncbi:NDR1/HIN1-like protein 13 [Mercurialis annua]|uniref:NDR1/HIN1-like protein 13 n=1 Tax=Mercurialis annua TaxID=3986 RepID=UPI002160A363|nr:NDR1/HIN1-like protein 13 [Mercurialis annua]